MIAFFKWYLLVSIVGIITFPIAYRLFSSLPGRAISLIRPLGMLLWGYLFWVLVSLGVLPNNPGGALLPLLALLFLSLLVSKGKWKEILEWISKNRRYIIKMEALFLGLFVVWAIVRAANPDIVGTEKPMEMAFINSILRSPSFPPQDPWLSGYAISYYYFGYVMVALLIHLSGVTTGIAFNLAVALWFALTGLGIYGVVFELLSLKKYQENGRKLNPSNSAILAPFLVLVLSNIEGFLEMLHSRGIFWRYDANGVLSSGFWTWLDIQELSSPPTLPFTWIPERISGIWWWRTSRVLQDYDLVGNSKEIIDEVPVFSFLLADLHPHVLAMPFVILIVMVCLAFYCELPRVNENRVDLASWYRHLIDGKRSKLSNLTAFALFNRPIYWIAALAVGGLAFLNTWDFPIYVALFSSVYTLIRYQTEGWKIRRLGEFIEQTIVMGFIGIILYIPFYLGFSSQAGGILPSLGFYTRGIHFGVMFASLIVPLILWQYIIWYQYGKVSWIGGGVKFSLAIIAGLWIFSYGLGLIMIALGAIERFAPLVNMFFGIQGVASGRELIGPSLIKRILQPGMLIVLFLILSLSWGAIRHFRYLNNQKTSFDVETPLINKPSNISENHSPDAIILLLILAGAGLVLLPEFIYLKDQFGWRMNTIFKFYFQAWILWGIAASYASVVIFSQINNIKGIVIKASIIVVFLMASVYPIYGILFKTNGFKPERWTLDGSAYLADYSRGEMDAISWLNKAPMGVVAEAIGGSYSNFARVSTNTGFQTVLGWPGHESQWRGGAKEIGSREEDVEKLFRSSSWDESLAIIQKYEIQYLFIGPLEKGKYRANDEKFQYHLTQVYKNNDVTIFEVPKALLDNRTNYEVGE